MAALVAPDNCSPVQDAEALRKACKGRVFMPQIGYFA